jgi:hypothetical protein
LQKDLPAPVEHQHMDGPVPQALTMNLFPRFLPNDLVTLVDHIENFVRHN